MLPVRLIGVTAFGAVALGLTSCAWMRGDGGAQAQTSPTTLNGTAGVSGGAGGAGQSAIVDGSRDGVQIEDLTPGETGDAGAGGARGVVGEGSLVVVRLVGRLEDGRVFFESEEAQGPWAVAGLVEGLARGMLGMRAGGVRRITVPSALGYGERTIMDEQTGEALIPAGSTLIFEVELLEVQGGIGVDGADDESAPGAGDGESS